MKEEEVYLSAEDWGYCVFCGEYDDRRFGVCFDCSGTVDDERQKEQMEKWQRTRTM